MLTLAVDLSSPFYRWKQASNWWSAPGVTTKVDILGSKAWTDCLDSPSWSLPTCSHRGVASAPPWNSVAMNSYRRMPPAVRQLTQLSCVNKGKNITVLYTNFVHFTISCDQLTCRWIIFMMVMNRSWEPQWREDSSENKPIHCRALGFSSKDVSWCFMYFTFDFRTHLLFFQHKCWSDLDVDKICLQAV